MYDIDYIICILYYIVYRLYNIVNNSLNLSIPVHEHQESCNPNKTGVNNQLARV